MSKRENISIHALREEGDLPVSTICTASCKFLSTPSARRATHFCFRGPHCVVISIHALREEGDIQDRPETPKGGISIHALREEGDPVRLPWWCQSSYFYPRPPRGGRPSSTALVVSIILFLSTPSARRATPAQRRTWLWRAYFYPRPPRGGRREFGISRIDEKTISIHALREEGDIAATARETIHGDFYPRPPRGGRHRNYVAPRLTELFLSTPSARRATRDATTIANGMRNFYPRPPRGGRQPSCSAIPRPWNFYPRPPRGGRRLQCLVTWSSHRYFYPRPPRGGRPRSGSCTFQVILFLSTPSARRATSTRLSRRIPF